MVTRYCKNVAGDFYVEEGCCITCAVPMTEAPEFFEMDEEQCYIVKQPSSAEETAYLLDVIRTQEAGCIRYAGKDLAIIQRMFEGGDGDSCDDPIASTYVRTVVRVNFPAETSHHFLQALAAVAQTELNVNNWPGYIFASIEINTDKATTMFGWYGDMVCGVEVSTIGDKTFKLELQPISGGGAGATRMFDTLLRLVPGTDGIWWMTQSEWLNGLSQARPY